jgi:3',5'-cyclic AMP phosphodiesterase CpdA
MALVLQVSDPHFGTEKAPVVQALVQLVREQSPNVLVLSGDITQRARARQFEAASRFVETLAVPLTLAVPGNHDIALFNVLGRALWPYAGFTKAFGADLEPQIDTPDLLAIGVNTTRRWRHKHGQVSDAQIRRVAQRLSKASPSQLRAVVVHQPVHVPLPSDANNLLRNHNAAVRAWSEAGADVIMGGHIHLPYVHPLHEVLKGLPRRTWCVQAGTALSSRVRRQAPNSVNLLRYSAERQPMCCHAEQWDFNADSARFEFAFCSELMLQRD